MPGKLTALRAAAEESYREALTAADPEEAVYRHFRVKDDVLRVGDVDYFLSKFQRVFVIGAGKAVVRMAQAVERILGPRLEGGLVITSRGQAGRLRKILTREGSHPIPDAASVEASEELLDLVEGLSDQDLVVCLLSGGASALLTAPAEGIPLSDLQRLTRMLLASGINIHEINTVRKPLCRFKGGKLAEQLYPATIITLVLSDVIADRLDIIGSGPTFPQTSSRADARKVLHRRGLWNQTPPSIQRFLAEPEVSEIFPNHPGRPDIFSRVHHQIIGSNRLSLLSAEKRARRKGLNTILLSSTITGESRELARFYAAIARELRSYHCPIKPPACLIAGGETTVTLRGNGKGGRCQELALALALEIDRLEGVVFLAAGTDGVDGPTDAAGAIIDSFTLERAADKGLDAEKCLENNDAYYFFQTLDDLIITGPTGTNVMDVHLLLVG